MGGNLDNYISVLGITINAQTS